MSPEIRYLSIEQIDHHPDNPRRFYPPKDVLAMARSIEANDGVDEALVVIPDEESREPDRYLCINGNMRLAGARRLKNPPLLKCEIRRGMNRREILLLMARTSAMWFAKDPISEARHYKTLIEEEGLSRLELSRLTGIGANTIAGRLKLLELDEEIQDLVARRKLPKLPSIVRHFNSIDDREIRIGLAREFARRRSSMNVIQRACVRMVEQLEQIRIEDIRSNEGSPSLAILDEFIASLKDGRAKPERDPSWEGIRKSTREICGYCDIKQQTLEDAAEPAWTLLTHIADETCDLCGLKSIRAACRGCPLPEFLIRMVAEQNRREELRKYVT